LELGLNAKAAELADQALAIDPRTAGAWAVRARLLRQAGRPQQALADFHRSLAYDPANRGVLWQLADLYRELGQPQRMLANLRSLGDTYPIGEEPVELLIAQAWACNALGQTDEAADRLAAAIRVGGQSPDLYSRLAEAQLQAGRPAEAEQSARAALALDPANAVSRTVLDRLSMAARAEVVPKDR
jgi:tetratricopeptide (TPR) repeat protein